MDHQSHCTRKRNNSDIDSDDGSVLTRTQSKKLREQRQQGRKTPAISDDEQTPTQPMTDKNNKLEDCVKAIQEQLDNLPEQGNSSTVDQVKKSIRKQLKKVSGLFKALQAENNDLKSNMH